MKTPKKIITLITFFTFCLSLFSTEIFAQEEVLTAPEEACKNLKPDYNEDKEIKEILDKPKLLSSKDYNVIFERAQNIYHSYIGCMFDFAENTVYKTEGINSDGAAEANTPNTNIIDWMSPDQACLSPTEISQIISQTTPSQMLGPILQTHSEYKDYLNALTQLYGDEGEEVNAAGVASGGSEQLLAKNNFLTKAGRKTQTEIDSSMVAIDLMFNSLKELRMSFVMHVHFQCTLKYLDKYRDKLGELRKLIQPLPDQLRDASITK